MTNRRVIYALLMAVALLSPWGNLQRFEALPFGPGALGLTSLLGVLVIGLGLGSARTLNAIRAYRTAGLFPAFLVLATVAPLLAGARIQSHWTAAMLGAYFLLAFTVAGLELSRREVQGLFVAFALSAAVMCALAILDHGRFIDVPGFNERAGRTGFAVRGLYAMNLTGPFLNRTAMGLHLALAFPLAVCSLLFIARGILGRTVWFLATAIIGYAGVLTLSRAWFLSAAVVFVYLVYAGKSGKRLPRFAGVTSVAVASALALVVLAPGAYQILSLRLESVHPDTVFTGREDRVRLSALAQTWDDLGGTPLGAGFTSAQVRDWGEADVHSNITAFLRAGGPLGLLLVFFFLRPVIWRALRARGDTLEVSCHTALLSFFVFGLTHLTMASIFAWMLLGMALRQHGKEHA